MSWRAAGLGILAALTACACAGDPYTAGPGLIWVERYGVTLERRWSEIRLGADPDVAAVQLTRSGPLLDRLFIASIESGRGLVTPGFEAYPRWWAGTPADALDPFLAESLGVFGYERVETVSRSPHPFAGRRGVLYTLTLERPGGMKIDGLALASVADERLDLIVFLAPREHYFPAREDEVRRLFASVVALRRP